MPGHVSSHGWTRIEFKVDNYESRRLSFSLDFCRIDTCDDTRSCVSSRRPRAVDVVQRLIVTDLFFFLLSV
jgi:hypothetical protein